MRRPLQRVLVMNIEPLLPARADKHEKLNTPISVSVAPIYFKSII